jgi:hypothetical protein
MTDRELLEKAAKAAGIEFHIDNLDACPNLVANGRVWHPLNDDGDALRLAVKCNIDFYQGDDDGHAAYAGYYTIKRQRFCVERHEDSGTDPYAATRRAIVRAAAAIGKEIKA